MEPHLPVLLNGMHVRRTNMYGCLDPPTVLGWDYRNEDVTQVPVAAKDEGLFPRIFFLVEDGDVEAVRQEAEAHPEDLNAKYPDVSVVTLDYFGERHANVCRYAQPTDTPLALAARMDRLDIMEALLKHPQLDVNARVGTKSCLAEVLVSRIIGNGSMESICFTMLELMQRMRPADFTLNYECLPRNSPIDMSLYGYRAETRLALRFMRLGATQCARNWIPDFRGRMMVPRLAALALLHPASKIPQDIVRVVIRKLVDDFIYI